ncbi:MAG: class I SAM-dependent methyltransferase [Legionellales bacterium]|nr:class I SAM-dependent methyltransferase [Legionellales bacterium]
MMTPPNPEMLTHSQKLIQIIAKTITQKGAISFADYMQMTLYYPGLGYYSAGTTKFGREGDFITAPELSPLFSYTLANYIASTFKTLPKENNLLEFGAGSGTMAADILIRLGNLGSLPTRYFILEVSADLRARQATTIQQKCPELMPLVSWLDTLPTKFDGIMLANEVLDAMPVHLCYWNNNLLQERYVDWQNNSFCWIDKPLSTPQLHDYLQPYLSDLEGPYLLEVNLASEAWLQSLATCQRTGELLLVDYGFSDTIFYHPQRYMGTLMCHYQHTAHDNPFWWPGLQDITTHVNFSGLGRTAVAAGFIVEEYDTQANFLLKHGLLSLAEHEDIATQYTLGQALKQLLLPTEMGELFKVMRLRKK